jgi:hypothetical protein
MEEVEVLSGQQPTETVFARRPSGIGSGLVPVEGKFTTKQN